MRSAKQNLWPFRSPGKSKAKPAHSSALTVGQAMKKARTAGKESGDTGLFRSWLEGSGLAGRSSTLQARLKREYEAGVESNFQSDATRRTIPTSRPDDLNAEFLKKIDARAGVMYKGRIVESHGDSWVIPSIDRESHFDTLKDAERFINSWGRNANPPEARNPSIFDYEDAVREGRDRAARLGSGAHAVAESAIRNEFNQWREREGRTGPKSAEYAAYKSGWRAKRNPAKFDRCVKAVEAKGGAANAYAVCTAAGTRNPPLKKKSYCPAPCDTKTSHILKLDDSGKNVWECSNCGRQTPVRKRNPASQAADLYESFHGKPATEELVIEEEIHEHEHLSILGRAIELFIETPTGLLAHIEFELDDQEEDPIFVCSSEDGKQLYFVGGDQSIDLEALKMNGEEWIKDRMVLGQFAEPEPSSKGKDRRKHNLTYHTRKDFDAFEPIDYQHDLGEETGERPYLEYEPRNKKLFVSGGQYRIEQPLFETSPGIEN